MRKIKTTIGKIEKFFEKIYKMIKIKRICNHGFITKNQVYRNFQNTEKTAKC